VVEVSWQHPIDAVEQTYIAQYKVVENGTVVDEIPDVPLWNAGNGAGPPTDPLFYAGTYANYRIDTYYNIAGVEYVRESCTKDFTSLPAPNVRAYNDAVDEMGWEPDRQWYRRTNFLNIVVNETDVIDEMGWEPDRQWYRRTNFSNIVVQDTTFMNEMGWEPDRQSINITRFDPSGIGSG
jgi:hypothetical protein